jgi:enoyl-CoA hydratase/carnithine racemase
MAYEHIMYHEDGTIGTLTLNRPEKRNALSRDLLKEFTACMETIARERTVRAVIVRGAGDHFCAGHDLNEVLNQPLNDIRRLFGICANLMRVLQAVPQPVIAQVQGVATAAGCQLVAACDLAVADEGALFATPGVKIGLFCTTPMVPLSRAVGRKKALEMLFTGKMIPAEEAREAGLVNRVFPKERLEEETRLLAREIAQFSLLTLGIGKQAFYQQINMSDMQAYDYAKEVISSNATMADAVEGMSAFLEKRDPVWKEE